MQEIRGKLEEQLQIEVLFNLLDYSSDEIFIINKEKTIVYVNKKSEEHYGLKPLDILGSDNSKLVEKGYWSPSIVPIVFKEKKPVSIKQETYLGAELLTRAIPILNDQKQIDYIFITSTEITGIKNTLLSDRPPSELLPDQSVMNKYMTNNYHMKNLYRFCYKIAPTNSTVLILGESGTGKGVLAEYIHQLSKRNNGPFITVNCAALPKELMESELFGYAPGSFSGARNDGKEGLFQTAHRGTIFLDEIGEMDISLQAKLLQVIQDKTFRPIGGTKAVQVDVRIIAATNQDLFKMVENKTFREDLFYRLNVIELELPALRQRREDIIPLIYTFLNKFNKKYGSEKMIADRAIDVLKRYDWPGNIRQLENVLERLVITSDTMIQTSDLPKLILNQVEDSKYIIDSNNLDYAIENVTREIITHSYETHQSSRKVAEDLGISQSRASRLIRKFIDKKH